MGNIDKALTKQETESLRQQEHVEEKNKTKGNKTTL